MVNFENQGSKDVRPTDDAMPVCDGMHDVCRQ